MEKTVIVHMTWDNIVVGWGIILRHLNCVWVIAP